jgi:hypothetical protein
MRGTRTSSTGSGGWERSGNHGRSRLRCAALFCSPSRGFHLRKRGNDLVAGMWILSWGSRGRRFKSGRPDWQSSFFEYNYVTQEPTKEPTCCATALLEARADRVPRRPYGHVPTRQSRLRPTVTEPQTTEPPPSARRPRQLPTGRRHPRPPAGQHLRDADRPRCSSEAHPRRAGRLAALVICARSRAPASGVSSGGARRPARCARGAPTVTCLAASALAPAAHGGRPTGRDPGHQPAAAGHRHARRARPRARTAGRFPALWRVKPREFTVEVPGRDFPMKPGMLHRDLGPSGGASPVLGGRRHAVIARGGDQCWLRA